MSRRTHTFFDIETAPLLNAADYLTDPEPDARLTDPEKIAADLTKKRAAQLDRCGLDWNVGRVVAMAWARDDEPIQVRTCEDSHAEMGALAEFWQASRNSVLVGFNVRTFDVPFCLQRSRYLNVPAPKLNLARYRRDPICDLREELTFDDIRYGERMPMSTSLKAFARRFGFGVTDAIAGSEIAELVEAGQWDAIAAHVQSDVELTRLLAQRIGIGSSEAAYA
jgi:predicted PolB exonuclease-like 3'-5' exonuclease